MAGESGAERPAVAGSDGRTQDDLVRRVGISRPQLANALQGWFGLSDAVARHREVVALKDPRDGKVAASL